MGAYIYTEKTGINDSSNDHIIFDITADNNSNSPTQWTQTEWAIGNTDNYSSSSPYIYTENVNPSNGRLVFHEYGSPGTDEGYWTYYDGYYENLEPYGEPDEYQFDSDYGYYGNHTSYPGWQTADEMTTSAAKPVARPGVQMTAPHRQLTK